MIEFGRPDPADESASPAFDTPALAPQTQPGEVNPAAPAPRNHLVAWLAIAAVVLFGLSTTLLGLGVSRMARPCRVACPAFSSEWNAKALLLLAPGLVSLCTALMTVAKEHWRRPHPWLPAILGCVTCVFCVYVGSVMLGVA
ncbi:hypothetical protein ACTQ49_10225 [Luteococcus sp. Sow4_B9]|uniref:hypothetical protein n=1 Tax=Luteococcus sp. Sow4_B9 TaxID=3438792 RepID=UPI003F9E40E2